MEHFFSGDLFSGAGGLSIGIEKTGFKVLFANEIEPDFAKTYEYNHPNSKIFNCDIRKINFLMLKNKYKKIHLLCGGPPCQGFSTVGKKNENDKRNSLFFEFLRAIKEISPEYVLFENVAGFMKLYEGRAYKTLTSELHKLNYNFKGKILEASDYGLPQYRKRTIIVAWKANNQPFIFPFPTHSEDSSLFKQGKKLTLMDAISDLPELSFNDSKDFYSTPPQNNYQKYLRKRNSILTEHNSSNYGSKMQKILSIIPPGGSVSDLPLELRPKKYFNNTYARLYPNKPSPTITRNFGTPSSSRCIHPFQNRALSTREGARIQGFFDDYVFFGSKTSKNLQIGNAVPPIFGEIVAKKIFECLNDKEVIEINSTN